MCLVSIFLRCLFSYVRSSLCKRKIFHRDRIGGLSTGRISVQISYNTNCVCVSVCARLIWTRAAGTANSKTVHSKYATSEEKEKKNEINGVCTSTICQKSNNFQRTKINCVRSTKPKTNQATTRCGCSFFFAHTKLLICSFSYSIRFWLSFRFGVISVFVYVCPVALLVCCSPTLNNSKWKRKKKLF